jgi:predicted nucleic acid-binding protein
LNVVDSSGWLEYFADADNAEFFAGAIEDQSHLVMPSLCIYEVFKRLLQLRDEHQALRAIALMRQGLVVDLDSYLALESAKLGIIHDLPLADSIILATARAHEATLWTQDRDFFGIAGVQYVAKRR